MTRMTFAQGFVGWVQITRCEVDRITYYAAWCHHCGYQVTKYSPTEAPVKLLAEQHANRHAA